MPEPILHAAGPVDLDALDAFLLSDRAPDGSMGLSDLDGFLAGIAVGPEAVPPGEWLPVVWSGGEPAFGSTEEANTVLGTIMGRHDEIVRLVDAAPDDYDPVFWDGQHNQAVVTDWAAGFLDAVLLRPKAWEPLVRHAEASALIVPPVVLGAENPERLPFGVRPFPEDEIKALHAAGAEIIPDCVVGIHGFWRERRAHPGAGGAGRPAVGASRRRRR